STSDDPTVYRPAGLVEPWRARDPLVRIRKYLTDQGVWSDKEETDFRSQTEEESKAAILAAERTSPPDIPSMFSDVYAHEPWHLREQQDEVERRSAGFVAATGAFTIYLDLGAEPACR